MHFIRPPSPYNLAQKSRLDVIEGRLFFGGSLSQYHSTSRIATELKRIPQIRVRKHQCNASCRCLFPSHVSHQQVVFERHEIKLALQGNLFNFVSIRDSHFRLNLASLTLVSFYPQSSQANPFPR